MFYPGIDASYVKNGEQKYINSNTSSDDALRSKDMALRFMQFIEGATGGRLHIDLAYIEMPDRITSISAPWNTNNDMWVGPLDIKNDLDWVAPRGKYDSIMVFTRSDGMPRQYYWGATYHAPPSEATNGAGYSFHNFQRLDRSNYMTRMVASEDYPHPEEIFVHEWCHQVEAYYSSLGYLMPTVDDPQKYGYQRGKEYDDYCAYYIDILSGRVYDTESRTYIGVQGDMWRFSPTGRAEELPSPAPSSNIRIISAFMKYSEVKVMDTIFTYAKTIDHVDRVELIAEGGVAVAESSSPITRQNGEKEWELRWKAQNTGNLELILRAYSTEEYAEYPHYLVLKIIDDLSIYRYAYFKEDVDWETAKKICEQMGGYLCTVTSEQEYEHILSIIPADGYHFIWLGATDQDSEGEWKWVTGEPFVFNAWMPGEPNGGTSENYLALLNFYGDKWGWYDATNDGATGFLGYICKWNK